MFAHAPRRQVLVTQQVSIDARDYRDAERFQSMSYVAKLALRAASPETYTRLYFANERVGAYVAQDRAVQVMPAQQAPARRPGFFERTVDRYLS